jgi:hypothetical protein
MERLHLVLIAALVAACKASGTTTAEHEAGAEAPAEYRGVAVAPAPPPSIVAPTVLEANGVATSCASLVAQLAQRACGVRLADDRNPPTSPSAVDITLMIGPPATEEGRTRLASTPYDSEAMNCVGHAVGPWNLPTECRQGLTLHFVHD